MKMILIIEDDPMMRELTQQILEIEGFGTITAENGYLGLQMVEQHHPDLIICDVMMPKLDGYSLIQKLQKNPTTATIPFIFLTAKVERCDLRQAMELGADDYLTKPFEAHELIHAVKTQLKKHQTVKQHYIQKIEKLETEFVYFTRHHEVTGLPNKLFLEEHFYCHRIKVYNQCQIWPLLLIDIDILHRDKLFFDTVLKDILIKIISERLKTLKSKNNIIDIIGYLKTEQLVILLKPIQDFKVIENIAQKILEYIAKPIFVNDKEVFVEAEIGIASYPNDELQFNQLLTCAEFALVHSPANKNKSYHFYSKEKLNVFFRKVILETDFRYALDRNEFYLYYQPQINISTGKVAGLESLIRWQHPEYGIVSPGEFIPIAEKSGFIIPLGEWIIKTVCQQIKSLKLQFNQNYRIAVNISAEQLKLENFSTKVIDLISEIGIPPDLLELELTETVLIQDFKSVKQKLDDLIQQGIKISIDDFGTGYASFKYLQELPFHHLKVDRYFISNIDKIENKQALLKSIMQTAENLNLDIIIEGVETQQELDWLTANFSDMMTQGYFFSPPLPIEELNKLLSQQSAIT
jgi:diguanylate cyclase (GGDEF)-like protein